MGRKKTVIEEEQIPLSESQNTGVTGRSDVVISGTVEEITDVLDRAMKKVSATESKTKAIEIKSAELVDQMFCNFSYKHTVGPNTANTVKVKSEVPVHHDLVAAFRRLDAHLAVKCEEVDPLLIGDINDIDHAPTSDTVNKFEVTSFIVDGPEESRSLILKGTKQLSTGETIKLETPKIAIDASYSFPVELSSTIQDGISEVEQYMQGKQAETNQLEMEFGGNGATEDDL